MIIRTCAYPRAALIGNPSDGYHGKTIAFVFSNYRADVELYETPELEILESKRDSNRYSGLDALCEDISLYGYYGGIRLIKAAARKFRQWTLNNGISIPANRNFTIRYDSTIPNRLGLAGSSAIITAAMKAMFRFYRISIDPARLANLVLSTERDELGIPAGLQDRVAQAYNHPVFMDFDREYMSANGIGRYTKIEIPEGLKLYVAYRTDLAEGSEILHSRLRDDYNNGVPQVLDAIRQWAELSDQMMDALGHHRLDEIPELINRNFDLRCQVCAGSISVKNRRMVELARECGASAKFTGSGGAIIGTYSDEQMYRRLKHTLAEESISVIKPKIVAQ